jgi:hypothetical protein
MSASFMAGPCRPSSESKQGDSAQDAGDLAALMIAEGFQFIAFGF